MRTISYKSSFYLSIKGPRAMVKKKKGLTTYSTNQETVVSKIFIICLGSTGAEIFQLRQTCKFIGPYREILSAKLTNHSRCTMSRPVIENKGHFTSLPFSFIYSFHFHLIKGSLTLVQPHNKPGFLLTVNGSTHQIQLKFC